MENLKKFLVNPFLVLLWAIAMTVSWSLLFSFDTGSGLRILFAALSGYGSVGLVVYCIIFSNTLIIQLSKIFSKDTWKTICMYIYRANIFMDDMEPCYRTGCLWSIMVISLVLFGVIFTIMVSIPSMVIRILHHLKFWLEPDYSEFDDPANPFSK